jgi:TPR repeat protein
MLFLVSGFQQGKVFMYDYLVRQTILSQLQSNMPSLRHDTATHQDMFIGLTTEPPIWELSVQHRLYDPMELSVPLNIETHSNRGRWFVQYLDYRSFSPPDYILPPHECTFAAHDRHPCPEYYILAEYRVNVNESGIANFSFVKLFFESFVTDRPMKIGSLVFLTEPRPMDINAMAARWFRKLAEEGDAVAQNKVGLMYLNGFADISQDDVKAFEWFQKSSVQMELDARLNVGLMYLQGRGVEKNDGVAARLIYSAAKEGNATAQYNYGFLCEQGLGVTKSENEAFTWYLKAAEQEYVLAQSRVGLMYVHGTGTSQNVAIAVRWLRKAADKNDKNAQYSLALLLYEGRGVPRDLPAAIALLGKSADQGYGPAQFSLGTLYQRGAVVAKDDRESYFWYQLAARHGENPQERRMANQAGQSIANLLTKQEKRALNQRVSDWRPLQPGQSPAWNN